MKGSRTGGAGLASYHCSRRRFLHAGTLAVAGVSEFLTRKSARAEQTATADAVIQIILSGGPSQLDTWDPKPAAPSTVRGPFRPISTCVPGMRFTEIFPNISRHAGQIAIVRSLSHDEAPVHETGIEILNTGARFVAGARSAAVGDWASLHRPSVNAPSWVWLETGASGQSEFRLQCQEAVRLVETGTRVVTVNMFPCLHDNLTWDCHANEADLPTTLNDYRNTIGPMFDHALAALLEDLAARGLLQRTLVVCAGEFGRSPKLNARGGRDHWTGVWSALFAGGGVRGGQVVGSSDRLGAEPRDRPIAANQVAATMLHALGISASDCRIAAPSGTTIEMPSLPILELF